MTPIDERAVASLTIPGSADFLVADHASVWVTNRGHVEQLTRSHAMPVRSVVVPLPCGVMACAFGAVWVANLTDASVYRIDTRAAKITARIATGLADPDGELSLAAGADAVWILTSDAGVLSRIDPETNTVSDRIQVAPHSYCAACGFDAVWISNSGDGWTNGSVQRIDPVTRQIAATIPVGSKPRFLAAGEGAVWALNQGDGTVSRIDPVTNRVTATIPVAGADGSGGDIAAGAGRIWIRTTKTLLSVIDPRTNIVVEQFGPPAGSGAVCVADGFVWVTAHDIQAVWVLPT